MDSLNAKLLSVVTAILLSFSAFSAVAADATKKADDVTSQTEQRPDISEGLIAQRFPLHGAAELNVEFRYVNGKLKYLYFWNTGENPINVDVFSGQHVMGESDDLLLKAPNVGQIILHVSPYDPETSKRLKSTNVSKTFVFSKDEDGIYILQGAPV